MIDRYFTKSLFKLALECPTKLYYVGKAEYNNIQEENAFLDALKDGGYQVGALAKAYLDGGVDLEGCDNEQAYQTTQELLKQDKVIIYEALLRHENMQVRCDILVKTDNHIEIIEVKSKSFNSEADCKYRNKEGQVISELKTAKGKLMDPWKEYLLDIAFQSYVAEKVIEPGLNINYYLMLVDKDQKCPVDGLNQKFIITKQGPDKKLKIVAEELSEADKNPWLLRKIKVDGHIQELRLREYVINSIPMGFDLYVKTLASSYQKDEKIVTELGGKCKGCEFKATPAEEVKGLKSGFKECWKQALKWQDSDFEDKTVLDLWKSMTKDKLIAEGKIKLDDFDVNDVNLREEGDSLSQSERQWLQIQKYQRQDNQPFIHPKLKDVMSKWVFPLHFIDFETCAVAIPFHKGHSPYEQIAFQFSHHILYEDGKIEHKSEFIETRPGVFPNYDFVRALKKELGQDSGTIFRFHNHENTILNAIYEQLQEEQTEIEDKAALMEFISSITVKKGSRAGERSMVDLEEVIRKYTYFPITDGRTSMKILFPAVLKLSETIQNKYSKPIYGAKDGIQSKNFENWAIVTRNEKGEIEDPYKRLGSVSENVSPEDKELFESLERTSEITDINEGGMALTAYAMMQYVEMSDVERKAIRASLLKYCEMDTLAMVVLYEFLAEQSVPKVAGGN